MVTVDQLLSYYSAEPPSRAVILEGQYYNCREVVDALQHMKAGFPPQNNIEARLQDTLRKLLAAETLTDITALSVTEKEYEKIRAEHEATRRNLPNPRNSTP